MYGPFVVVDATSPLKVGLSTSSQPTIDRDRQVAHDATWSRKVLASLEEFEQRVILCVGPTVPQEEVEDAAKVIFEQNDCQQLIVASTLYLQLLGAQRSSGLCVEITETTIAAQVFYEGIGYSVHRVTYDKNDRKRLIATCKHALEDAPKDFDGEVILGGHCAARCFREHGSVSGILAMKVLLCPEANYLAWRGATILANVPTANAVSFWRPEYEEVGPPGVLYKFLS
eukprot:GEMP01095021.1.p1 GENE.GEMP01095021.1~~GEMP01095021.1.p1  ORF type:complete len:228 (+),score=53.55 GEMP01095021.1:72-755(+)